MSNPEDIIPSVDLVIVIDTSGSMGDEARSLSAAAEAAINAARSSCPSDLRVAWFGIEGTWSGTSFNRTLRDYLTQDLNVAESSLRQRKRGEVAAAGAQEDGARAIEDVSAHFDWREGAARAIFYLGDEALEGGGVKTQQDDIDAANLAIEGANTAGVTVHTYFGTSSSRYREGIASEFARLATETGGQAFSDQDAIAGFSAVLEKVICGSRVPKKPAFVLKPGTIYVQDCPAGAVSKLYTLNLSTGKATLVGEIATDVFDIAFVGSKLYGLDQIDGSKTTRLVEIDPETGSSTAIGDIGFYVVGLSYDRQTQTLYATSAKQPIAIDLETGKGTATATFSKDDCNYGEISFAPDGTAYITLIDCDRQKYLATCNLQTGEVNLIGDTGFPDVASLEFVGETLYGVTGNFFDLGKDGQLICFNLKTGKGSVVAKTDPPGRWGGIAIA
ncbi:MAG: hypothetical protein SVX43_20350 [Cyanobacteriota bacterium]|nr:hypothetical protein [Cyanobacteriota bacterium]